ncbi:hypothetical protein ACOSQ4_020316 [Xanthoceras sorbifolium]
MVSKSEVPFWFCHLAAAAVHQRRNVQIVRGHYELVEVVEPLRSAPTLRSGFPTPSAPSRQRRAAALVFVPPLDDLRQNPPGDVADRDRRTGAVDSRF